MKNSDTRQTIKELDALRRLKVARFAIFFTTLVSLCWLVFFGVIGDFYAAKVTALTSWPIWAALVLFLFGFARAGRFIWLTAFPATCLVTTLAHGHGVNPELIFLAIIGFPFLFYSWDSERRPLLVMVVYQSALALVALSFDRFGDPSWLPAPGQSSVDPVAIDWGVRMTVAVILLIELSYFAFLAQRSTTETRAALEDARAAAKSRGEFLANMSHEIRTPMNGLIGMIEVLETMDEDKRHERSIGMIRNSAFSLLRILDDILDASQIDAGKLSVERTKVELTPLVESAAQTLQSMSDQLEVELRMLVDPRLPEWIWADSGRLRQILLNLLSNAVKYSSKRLTGHTGYVFFHVRLEASGDLGIEVRDNGTGMSQEVMDTLFQPFAEGESTSRRVVGGTGLGLSITNSLVNLMGGTISVAPSLGQEGGTTVNVVLPLLKADGPQNKPNISGLNVLCFDLLDVEVRKGMLEILEGSGANVRFASTVEELDRLDPTLPADSLFMIPTPDEGEANALLSGLRARLPDAKVVRFSASRSARYGLQDSHSYLVQIFPMMGSDLFRALSTLGGLTEASKPTARVAPADPLQELPVLNRASPTGPRILVVEDNEINRMVLSKQLEILGHQHDLTEHGEEGLAAWKSGGYDLILTDCQMPIMDGFQMTQAIRDVEAEGGNNHIPIIAVTANALKGEKERCLELGMDDYLAKPIELENLRERLELHLPKPGQDQ